MTPAIRRIVESVAAAYELAPDALLRGSLHTPVPPGVKSLCYLLAVELTEASYLEVSRQFGRGDHKPVAIGCDRAKRRITRDARMREVYESIRGGRGGYEAILLTELEEMREAIERFAKRQAEIAGMLGLGGQESEAAE